jgi:hypothetical protein
LFLGFVVLLGGHSVQAQISPDERTLLDALDPTAEPTVRHDAEQFLTGDAWYEAWCQTAGIDPTPLLSRRQS